MSDVDRSRIEAVRLVQELGYVWDGDKRAWRHPALGTAAGLSAAFIRAADEMHGELTTKQAAALVSNYTPEIARVNEFAAL